MRLLRFLWVLLSLVAFVPVSKAETKRALVVGIDHYAPPKGARVPKGRSKWKDLRGAVADAEAWSALLATQLGFSEKQVKLLVEAKATRKAILDGLASLAKASKAGDVAFFAYAGHGSQVFNSLSREADQRDESIVPADAWKGALDVRDKELARAFARILATGATLVAVFDSCHSGSISRGLPTAFESRKLEYDPRDARDDAVVEPAWKQGAIVFSAAQSDELAWEGRDSEGNPRGLFTVAFHRALSEAAPNESSESLFRRVRAQLASVAAPQVPVLEALPDRARRPLFGGALASSQAVGILAVKGGWVLLQDGAVSGLTVGTELVPVVGPAQGESLRIRVEVVDGLSRSRGKVIEGAEADVKAGGLLRVDKWAPPTTPLVTLQRATTAQEVMSPELLRALSDVATFVDDGATYTLATRSDAPGRMTLRFERVLPGLSTLPDVTDWVAATPDAAVALWQRVARVAGWLRLPSPPADPEFPYRLEVGPAPCEGPMPESANPASGPLEVGTCAGLWLVTDTFPEPLESRWITVLVVDSGGGVHVLFPAPGGVENRYPPDVASAVSSYPLDRFDVTAPAGVDTYVLLTTTEQLPSVSALESEAVKRTDPTDPLTALLSKVGRRRGGPPVHVGWTLQRLVVPSELKSPRPTD